MISRNSSDLILAVALGTVLPAMASAQAGAGEVTKPGFSNLRQDEDWSLICRQKAEGIDAQKCVPLGSSGEMWFSLGGEARERYEYTRNPVWGDDRQDKHGVFLQRYVLHGDLRLNHNLRFFGQLYSALENGRAGSPSPVDENRADLQQAFIDVSTDLDEDTSHLTRLGRQELRYGSARLVDVREGPNVRRKFDGAITRLKASHWQIDGIAVRPSRLDPGSFNDETDEEQALWGAYVVGKARPWLPFGSSLDVYYLGFDSDRARYQQGVASERRHTVGARLWGRADAIDWNWEAIYQGGSFGTADIRAWSLASETGYSWREILLAPRVSLSANVASGDEDPNDRKLGTFNPLFPRGNYFSELALLGPRNFANLHPAITLNPTGGLSLTADVDAFWRLETNDGVYSPGGALLRPGGASGSHYVGTELSLNATWQVNRHVSLSGIYAHFFPGPYIRETGPAKPIDFFEFTVKVQF